MATGTFDLEKQFSKRFEFAPLVSINLDVDRISIDPPWQVFVLNEYGGNFLLLFVLVGARITAVERRIEFYQKIS